MLPGTAGASVRVGVTRDVTWILTTAGETFSTTSAKLAGIARCRVSVVALPAAEDCAAIAWLFP
jgi:hypothetical protein